MTRRHQLHAAGLLLLEVLWLPANVQAADRTSYELVAGNPPKLGRLGLQWDWKNQWFKTEKSYLTGYWDASFVRLSDPEPGMQPLSHAYRHDLGVAAVLRFQRHDRNGFYAEAGTGPHYILGAEDAERRRYATHLVFNTHAGIGFVWKNGLDLGLKATQVTPMGTPSGMRPESLWGVGLRYRW